MKFFIDTANVDEIREANSMGMVDGVTTNPTLIAKEGREFEEIIKEICEIVDGPVSAEVISTDTEGMLKEARDLAKLHDNIVIKIPMIVDGLKATRKLTDEGIKTNVTLVKRQDSNNSSFPDNRPNFSMMYFPIASYREGTSCSSIRAMFVFSFKDNSEMSLFTASCVVVGNGCTICSGGGEKTEPKILLTAS